VLFDPAAISDHSTYDKPHQLATGVADVIVNGKLAFADGAATEARAGRFVHGRAWKQDGKGGCRQSAADWIWVKP
jgi:N-acyl-D-amino-acid deacylase